MNKKSSSHKVWDNILKSIVEEMPNQLLPLIKDVFGTEYDSNVTISLLPTESLIPSDNPQKFTSIYSDIALKIGNDVYHIESQMTNDDTMAIRMIKYDFHLALISGLDHYGNNEYSIDFPRSVVIYPAPNKNIPDELICHLRFPDGNVYNYKVPTVKVQQYSLEDIQEKHLTVFLPYKLLQFRPRLTSKTKPVTEAELTAFIEDIIFILREEQFAKRITENQFSNYCELIIQSADKVFNNYQQLNDKVVDTMTKSTIILPSARFREYEQQLAEKDSKLAEKDSELAEKDKKIAELEKLLAATKQ